MTHRLCLLLAAALSLGTACIGFSPDVGVPQPAWPESRWWDSGSDSEVPLDLRPWGALVFSGNGGVGEEGVWGDLTHTEVVAQLESDGMRVDRAEVWDGALGAYRILLLPGPGMLAEEPFTEDQLADLRIFLRTGGVVVIEGEHEGVFRPAVAHALLEALEVPMRLGSGYLSGQATPEVVMNFTSGITAVGVQAGAPVEPGGADCLFALGDRCAAAVATASGGWVVLIGDGDLLNDLDSWDDERLQNRIFLRNLIGL